MTPFSLLQIHCCTKTCTYFRNDYLQYIHSIISRYGFGRQTCQIRVPVHTLGTNRSMIATHLVGLGIDLLETRYQIPLDGDVCHEVQSEFLQLTIRPCKIEYHRYNLLGTVFAFCFQPPTYFLLFLFYHTSLPSTTASATNHFSLARTQEMPNQMSRWKTGPQEGRIQYHIGTP